MSDKPTAFGWLPLLVLAVATPSSPAQTNALFSDANWISLGGITNPVTTAVVDGAGNLYIGGGGVYGDSGWVGDTNANFVAKWNGSSWSPLGLAMNGIARTLAVSGTNLYAGGSFTTVTNPDGTAVTANRIAKWDGSSWSALGSGMNGYVGTLAVSGSNLYAGGSFTTAGGNAAKYIAKWDGTSWSALGSGSVLYAFALALSGSDLYVGGNWMHKWDGTNFSALGSGLLDGPNGPVYALAVSGSNLYTGGDFTTAGGSGANSIAKWDGSSWSTLGSGMNGYVQALAVSGSNLYAGGNFTTAGGNAANRIGKWDGSSWSALGSGVDGNVISLAVSGSDLYAGGIFTNAGGKISRSIARARIDFNPDNIALQADVPGVHTNTLTFAGVPDHPYIVEYSTNLADGSWFFLSTNAPATNGIGTVIDSTANDPQRFYRVGY